LEKARRATEAHSNCPKSAKKSAKNSKSNESLFGRIAWTIGTTSKHHSKKYWYGQWLGMKILWTQTCHGAAKLWFALPKVALLT
jgi:hypothetical protein